MPEPFDQITPEAALRLSRLYEAECGLMYPMFEMAQIFDRIHDHDSLKGSRGGPSKPLAPGSNYETDVMRMVLAIGLSLDGQTDTAARAFALMQPVITSGLLDPPSLELLTLLVLAVRLFSYPSKPQ